MEIDAEGIMVHPALAASGRYLVAVVAVAVTAAVTFALPPLKETPTLLFVVALIVSAWNGGRGPGVLAVILSVFAVNFFFVEPRFVIHLQLADLGRAVVLILVLLVILWFVEERKKSAAHLQQKVDALSQQAQLLDMASILVSDLDDCIVVWNRGAEQLFGYSAAEALRQRFFTLLKSEFSIPLEDIKAVLQKTGNWQGEIAHVRKDGDRVVVASRWLLHRNETSGARQVLQVNHDVTAQRQAEQALRTGEQRFARFMQRLPGPAWIKDLDGRYIFANDAMEKLIGLPADKLYGSTDADVLPSATAERLKKNDWLAIASVSGIQTIETLEHPDGAIRHLLVNKFPIVDASGQASLLGGIAVDVTDRKRAEDRLRHSRERNEAILRTAIDAIVTIDAEGKIVEFNPAAEQMFGYVRDSILGRSMADLLVPPAHREAHRRGMERFLATGEAPFLNRRVELSAMRSNGQEFPVEIAITRLGQSDPPFFTGYIRDLSEQKRAERGLAAQHSVTRVLAEAASAEVAIPSILQVVAETLGWMAGSFWLADTGSSCLQCIGFWSHPSLGKTQFELLTRQTEFAPGIGLPGRVWQDGEPAWVPDVVRDDNFPRAPAAEIAGLHGAFGIPVVLDRQVFGVLEFFSREIEEPDEELLRIMSSIGGQVGQFIRRKRAEAALRENEQRLRLALSAGRIIAWEWDPGTNTVHHSADGPEAAGIPASFSLSEALALVHPDDVDRVRAAGEQAVADGTDYRITFRCIHPLTRAIVFLETRGTIQADADGKTKRVVGVTLDITERKQAEESVRAATEQLWLITDAMAAPVTRCSRDLRYLWVNRPYAEWLGKPIDAIVGQSIRDVLGDEAFQGMLPYFERVLAGELVQYERESDFRGIGRRTTSCTYSPTRDAAGRIDGWVAVVIDVTERKRHEESLRQGEERLRMALDAGQMGAWEWNIVTGEVIWSENLEAMHGLARGSFGGTFEAFQSHLHPDDRDLVLKAIAHAVDQRSDYDLEFRNVWPDGSVHWILGKGKVFTDSAGQPIQMIGVCLDVTQRKQTQETIESLLRISERLNSTLDVNELLDVLVQEAIKLVGAESGVSGLCTSDGMVCSKYFQKGHVLPLEYCWPPMHGLPGWLIVHKRPYRTNNAFADQQIVHELCRRFGVWSALSTPIVNAQGKVLGFFEVHNKADDSDFTDADEALLLAVSHSAAIAIENALAYERIQRAEQSLKEVDRRKDEFIATLAHELRNPLTPIRSGLDVFRLMPKTAPDLEPVRLMMERQMHHLVRLIDDLLDVSRIRTGKIELRRDRVELGAIVRDAVEACRPNIENSGLNLYIVEPEHAILLDADPTRLAQVLLNLLNNAAKFTPRGGRVDLTVEIAESAPGSVIIRVADTGIGIPPDMLTRVFEKFAQVHHSVDQAGGLGIGLSLVRMLVELHGGTVEARSDGVRRGSEFIVRLPIVEVAAAVVRSRPASDAMTNGHPSRRILLVDDAKDVADSLAMMLTVLGHSVFTANDGQGAIESALNSRPDVAILDIGMPGMSGYDLARALRAAPGLENLVLVALTGWGDEADRRRSLDSGFDHHLVKPVQLEELQQVLGSTEKSAIH